MSRNKPLAALLLSVFLLAGCGQAGPTEPEQAPLLQAPEQVERATVQVEVGTFYADANSAKADSSNYIRLTDSIRWNTSGAKVKEISIRKGDVKAGDVLMTFDVAQHRADLEELRLQLESKQVQLDTGRKEREAAIAAAKSDMNGLTGHEAVIASLKLEKLQAEYEQFLYSRELELTQLQTRIGELRAESAQDCVVAPCDGTVELVADLKLGDTVPSGTVLYYIQGESVPCRVINGILPAGSTVYISTMDAANQYESFGAMVEARDYLYTGRVVSSSQLLPSGTMQYSLVALDGDNPMPNLAKTYWFYLGLVVEDALLIPEDALYTEDDQYYVQVLEDGIVRKRYVSVGMRSAKPDRKVWILDGVAAGQTLVLPEGVS